MKRIQNFMRVQIRMRGAHFCTRGGHFNEWVQIDSLQTIKPHLHYNINIEKLLLKSNLFHDFFL